MMPMVAPQCPISTSQSPGDGYSGNGATFPTPPIATDLDSLIAAVNALRDILRQFTGQWTVNNVQQPSTPNRKIKGNTYYSQFPEWEQVDLNLVYGLVYHKDRNGTDRTQAAYVQRINGVTYKNRMQTDP